MGQGYSVPILSASVLEDEVALERVFITDLKCGDLFKFRGKRYVTFMVVKYDDAPRVVTITAASYEDKNVIAGMHLYFRTRVFRVGHVDLKLEKIDSTDEEVLATIDEFTGS